MQRDKPIVVVAGASGFIGRALPDVLADDFELVGLTRDPIDASLRTGQSAYLWRQCDLFSRIETRQAVRGAHHAVYLAHSMIPSAHLTQGDVRDMDLICADNFARAARHHGIKHIVNMSGMIPETDELTDALSARLEIAEGLRAYGASVTTLRAAMVLGPGSSSMQMLTRLIKRLPVMALPRWTRSKLAPIDRRDVAELLSHVLSQPNYVDGSYDIAGPDITTYAELLKDVAELLDRRRYFFSLPGAGPRISTATMTLITGEHSGVARPIVDSLQRDLLPRDRKLQDAAGQQPMPLQQSLRQALDFPQEKSGESTALAILDDKRTVRSVQRLPLPEDRSARWVAREYARWLPRFLRPLVRVDRDENDSLSFYIRPVPWPILVLEFDDEISNPDRQLFWITGGLLTAPHARARLEFREVLSGQRVLAAIHQFHPRLPWFLYVFTQAKIHSFVMRGMARHLDRLGHE